MKIANWLTAKFDRAQEVSRLSDLETWLRRTLKLSLLGLASLERTIDRQRSRIRWLRDGDANTKLFQAVANGRRSKNFISCIKKGDEIITDQADKDDVFSEAFENLLGKAEARVNALDMEYLQIPQCNLGELDLMFTEEEVWKVIKEIPAERAPGPDGFIGAFYHTAWPIIKGDIMAALMKLYVGDGRGFEKLNRAHIVLIPKNPDALEVGDYMPISLPHSFAKLFAKMLANRARPRMSEIMAINQSAFIKGRNIHDKYLLVRQLARKLYARKEKGLFLKLDISKAFDSLSWPFLLENLRAKGFDQRWISWISILLRSTNTRVLVNGVPARRFRHAKGLRQSDPVSPLLFVIAMDSLTSILRKATEQGVLSSFRGVSATQRLSLYADDLALFLRPTTQDLTFVKDTFDIFGNASGLKINYGKSNAILIRHNVVDHQRVEAILHCKLGNFPCRYLGLQLAINQLTRADWQPLLDQVRKFIPA